MKKLFNKIFVIMMVVTLFMNLFVANTSLASGVYNTDTSREAYGSNYYGTSNIREWLNSSEYQVTYSHNPPIFTLNSYNEEKGFLADGNFTPGERNMITSRNHKVVLDIIDSNVKEGGTTHHVYNSSNSSTAVQNYDTNAYYKHFNDRVFLLSVKQLYEWVTARGWSYQAKPTTQAVFNSEYASTGLNSFTNWHYFLSTPRSGFPSQVRYVNNNGTIHTINTNNNYVGIRPAINLKTQVYKASGSGSITDPAFLGTSGEALEVGDYVRFGKYYEQNILWRVINKDEQGTVLFAENILTIKPYDAAGDGTYPDLANNYEEFPSEVTDIHTEVGYNWIKVSWNNPVSESLEKISIYKDGIKIHEVSPLENEFLIEALSSNTEYEIRLTTGYSSGAESEGISFTVKTMEHIEEVQNLFSSVSFDYIYLTWDNPEIEDLQKVIIYQDGVKVGEVIVPENEFFVEGLNPETEYEIRLTTKYGSGTETEGIKVKLTTLAIPYETIKVRNLKAETTHNRVNLSWQNPDVTVFDFVRIYRKTELQEQTAFTDLLFGTKVYANTEEYDPIFETNGTKFNDLTVVEETTYEYMLNSVTTTNEELEGVTIQATTTEAPPPNMGGVTETTNENGDYVYTWTSPTTGQVKIYVGGTEYTTVPASDGQVVIPNEDMKYTVLGNPDVQLQPILPNGKEGKKSRAGIVGISLPFGVSDLLSSSVGLMAVFGSFILLVLAIRFAPRLLKLLKKSVRKKQEDRRLIP